MKNPKENVRNKEKGMKKTKNCKMEYGETNEKSRQKNKKE